MTPRDAEDVVIATLAALAYTWMFAGFVALLPVEATPFGVFTVVLGLIIVASASWSARIVYRMLTRTM